MLGSSKLTMLLGSAPPPTAETPVLKAYVKALANEAGLALFYVVPGAKEPLDCRTPQSRNKALKEAEAAGLPKPTGLHMATSDPVLLTRWLEKYRKDRDPDTPVNMAVEVGRSRLVVVDVDTEEEVAAFRDWWAWASGDPLNAYVAPTVSSPGVQDSITQEWIHRGGGHYYFTLPADVVLPSVTGALKVDHKGSAFNVYWRDRYLLIPPSCRAEGRYVLSGTDHPIPAALLAMIQARGMEVAERVAQREERAASRRESGQVDGIESWGLQTPWEVLLEAAGWLPSGRVDQCSCPIWTRPENPANKKSATAHDAECSDPRFDPLNPPLHVWSDNVTGGLADWIHKTGSKTLSKLQFVAAVFHEGDVTEAMLRVGIAPDDGQGHGLTQSTADLSEDLGAGSSAALADQLTEARTEEAWALANPSLASVSETAEKFAQPANALEPPSPPTADEGPRRPVLAPFDHWRNLPPPEFIVDGWIEDRALSAMIGPSGIGKSAVVLDMACSISVGIPWQGHKTKRSRVLYIAGEGGAGAAQRIKAWELEHQFNVGQDLFMITEAVLIGSKDRQLWDWLAGEVREHGIRLVIFDTLARMSLGLEENSASDMGNAVARFDKLRREADCGVMVVHHTARGQRHGRGSTAILGAMDSEVLVDEPAEEPEEGLPGKALAATVTKQKNGRDGISVPLTICERHGSIVVADQYGKTGDPLAGTLVEFPVAAPETDTTLAIRLAEHLEALPMQGATKTELARDVRPGKAYRKDRNAWRAAVVRAVDRGLATGLLVTKGNDSAQRYGRGSVTPDQARALDSAEAADRMASSD